MARQKRIEYAGAIYHVMARGNRRGDIVLDDEDRKRFVETLAEVVGSSGWVLYAWVLMDNHYHLLFRTPEPNLVEGMRWFQNTWTRRFNSRHRLWGHLFGGRYKAIPVGEGGYFTRLIHYIHLNPVRAGMVKRKDGIETYPWCSMVDYTQPPRKRRRWVEVALSLEHVGKKDTADGRRRFLALTESFVDWKAPGSAGASGSDGLSLQSTVRRGWYFGTEEFREKLVEKLGEVKESGSDTRRKGYSGEQTRDHGAKEAERIIGIAENLLEIKPGAWDELPKGDWRKGMVASLVRKRALVDNGWLAMRLRMGARNTVSRSIKQANDRSASDRAVRRVSTRLAKMSKSFD